MRYLIYFVIFFQFALIRDLNNFELPVYYTETGYAEFTSSVPLHTFTGSSEHLTGFIDLQENIVDFYLDLNTIKTGISRRDRDMYRTLNVDEYPFAEFTGSIGSPFDEGSTELQNVVVSGEFTIHGVTREVSIEGTLQHQNDEIQLKAEWILLLDEYDIEPPGILFYRVTEEQQVLIEATLQSYNRDEFFSNAN